jgi:hypothetical protein
MRRHIIVTFLTLYILTSTYGHGGRTDSDGGHYNRQTGQYHYHNGGGGSGLLWVVIIGGVLFFLFVKSGDKNK